MAEPLTRPDGSRQTLEFQHTIFLLGISADSQAGIKMAMWLPVSAYLACGRCLFEGFKRKRSDSDSGSGSRGTYFGGFAEPAEQHILDLRPCKVGDACLQLSNSMQHARAKLVEVGQAQPTVAGCTGYSVFPKLWTMSATMTYLTSPSSTPVSVS